jgi:hypothetical protein
MPEFDELLFENLPTYDRVASLPYCCSKRVVNVRWNCCIEGPAVRLLKGTTRTVDIEEDEFE